ncbi:uncharacterized protein LOC111040156 [Myzus persicae]|uniref:uncharacterized protein LOC111040156 n=1 Tax=Myzus persicae TaxID=13164 RepID=UPI000B92F82F|nr:uncharacterized protein LOC111040156 [Myzus persicae]
MKYFFIILTEFMILVDSGVKDFKILPNLPLGEYRVNVIAIHHCSTTQKYNFQYNFFLFKTSRTTVQLRGNISCINRAFDDSLLLRGSMAIKDKIGGWQNNAYVYQSPMAYSGLKKLFGAEFAVFLNSFGVNDTKQNSIPPGIYTTKGYDISNYPSNTNLPKQIFYGTYKMNINYTEKSGSLVGCYIFVIEIKRPWEIE